MITSAKEQIFAIMGKEEGNAYWRASIRCINDEDLALLRELLDEINALEYKFSNLHRLTVYEDIRFIPIILKYIHQNRRCAKSLLYAFHCRAYYQYTPELIELYNKGEYSDLRSEISNALLRCRHKKFISQYLEIVNDSSYGSAPDLVMEILCHFKVKEALPRLLKLYERYPDAWRWDLLKYGWYFNDKSIIPYIDPYLTCDNAEYRCMARKAIEKISR